LVPYCIVYENDMDMDIIVVGCGGRGHTYARYAKDHGLRVVAAADSQPDKLQAFGKEFDIPAEMLFGDWRQALQSCNAVALINATPDREHYQITVAALEKGLHVLLEKPMSPSEEECRHMVALAEEKGLVLNEDYSFLQSISDADYIPNLSQFADQEVDLIVAAGFLFEKAIQEIATNYPDQKILFIDAVVDAPNVMNAVFAEHEGSFLVGVAAALKAQEAGKNMVGFVGGADFELIQRFEAGFEQGVKMVDPDMEIVIQYASGFDKAEEGQSLATKMFDDGCYVIYHAAGGTGNGVIKEAKDRATEGQDVWVIGVDKDQYEEGFYGDGSKSVILTSMLKAVDEAAYVAAKSVEDGTFQGGIHMFDLKANGVRIPEENPNLTDEWVQKINEFAEKIKNGEIEVDPVPSRVKGN